MLFTPFYLPMAGLIILFIFTYMAILPLGYKLYMLMFIYMFTVLMAVSSTWNIAMSHAC